MRNALAVVGAVDIHLATAIGAIEQAREGSCFTPAVRVASDIPSDFLHKVKGLLVNDRLMGILKNRPFVLRDIMAFLVLDRKSTRLNSSHSGQSRMPSSA